MLMKSFEALFASLMLFSSENVMQIWSSFGPFQFHAPIKAKVEMNPALNWMHGKEKRKKEFNKVEQIFRTRA